ncbi:ketodeoxygluconokinase [Catenovulum agarivorans DS-2]|uniref:Ketodeoxygluconokinase n=1 Tax=Catenovulum agarivorans DS-2 TaxID=1328313 RepID=W7R1L5_9ALTE|nr:sugar kinase [Catenovulum agarivorans]EWH11530.1 ketodeoxygluconokinase [Catenovulum agarivorans DS-2]
MSQFVAFGECMIELSSREGSLHQGFGGDVFNTCVYLKRTFKYIDSGLLTAVGQDLQSEQMVATFAREQLNIQNVLRHPQLIPGLYWIHNDEVGEKIFNYWRDNSAAKRTIELVNASNIQSLGSADIFFFSGISLAILPKEDQAKFFDLLNQLKKQGVKIAFDPNYRPKLWANPQDAKDLFHQCFLLSDILLPGVEDFSLLYGIEDEQGVLEFLAVYDIKELVLKNGAKHVTVQYKNKQTVVTITPVTNVVDTTSAGDSFNGVYFGARLNGYDIETSVKMASRIAGEVVQHKGAIVDADIFSKKVKQLFLDFAPAK